MEPHRCIFCEIVAGRLPASVIYEDEHVLSFMTIKATRPGECLVIPKSHIDHFTDITDDLTSQIMRVGQRIGRRMRDVFPCDRVGYVVHGYGVAHAHLIIVPQQDAHDIVSARHMTLTDGEVKFGDDHIPPTPRDVLDHHAKLLASKPSFAEALASMPNVGLDTDFERDQSDEPAPEVFE
jgi:histidine triad (HIT) family protein